MWILQALLAILLGVALVAPCTLICQQPSADTQKPSPQKQQLKQQKKPKQSEQSAQSPQKQPLGKQTPTLDTPAQKSVSPSQPNPRNQHQAMKRKLTPEQIYVTQQCGTEPPFRNAYWNNHRKGIYVSVISGEPLFSSEDKFDSGSGWPSFTKPIDPAALESKTDRSHGMVRTEVRGKQDNAHLGHVFPDGPGPSGERFCINSAALRFIPFEDLEKEGYGEYKKLFK